MGNSRISLVWSWPLFVLWTLLLCYLMLSPSKGTVRSISLFFGGTEWTDAMGHVVLIFIETALAYNLLRHYVSLHRALRYACWGTLVLGLSLETAQIWIPSRGASLLDASAALLGVGLFAVVSRKVLTRVRE